MFKNILVGSTLLCAMSMAHADTKKMSLMDRINGKELSQKTVATQLKNVKAGVAYKQLPPAALKEIAKFGEIQTNYRVNGLQACDNDEELFLQLEQSVLNDFVTALKKQDWTKANAMLGAAPVTGTMVSTLAPVKGTDFLTSEWNAGKAATVVEQFAPFAKISDLKMTASRYTSEKRDAKANILSAVVALNVDVRGTDNKGNKISSAGVADVCVEKTAKSWEIKCFKMMSGTTVAASSNTPVFTASNALNGKVESHLRREAIRRGGYALAVNDINNDGREDILVGSVGNVQIFTQDQNGNFAPAHSDIKETLVKSAAILDFNNDGYQDMMMVRFVPPEMHNKQSSKGIVSLYKGSASGTFSLMPDIANFSQVARNYAMPSAVADFDGNGLNDIYIGYPGIKDFTHARGDERKTLTHGLYFNQGNDRFVASDSKANKETFNTFRNVYPHASYALDYNNDGLQDIVVLDDRDNLSPVFMNKGKGEFYQGAEQLNIINKGFAMSATFGDINQDGRMDVIISNVETAAGERIRQSCEANWGRYYSTAKEPAMKIFFGTEWGTFAQIPMEKLGIMNPGEGLGGVKIFDYDNDGLEDIYVVNGLWSGTDESQDFSSQYIRHFTHMTQSPSSGYRNTRGPLAFVNDSETSQSIYMDILAYFKGDIHGGKKQERPSIAGHQRNRLYKNLGKGRFIEVGYQAGLDSIADGYMVATADLNKDGKMDLVLRNADPGSKEVNFSPVEVFMNNTSTKNNALTLQLVGQTSSADAIGSKVSIELGNGTSQTHQLMGLEGTVQSSKLVHFGLGTEKKAKTLSVVWPSGQTTVLKNVGAGFHKIIEPKKSLSLNQ